MPRFAALACLLLIAACSSPGRLAYVAPPQIISEPPLVADVQVVDRRDEKPNRIATIRGGYGNPVKVMDTTETVAEQVRGVFTAALAARGMLRTGGPAHFEVSLHTLYGDQFVGRKVEWLFDVVVRDTAGTVIYSDRSTGKDYEFTFLDNGIFASIDTLGKAVAASLSKAVDEALDKPSLRQALQRLAAAPVS